MATHTKNNRIINYLDNEGELYVEDFRPDNEGVRYVEDFLFEIKQGKC